MVFGEVNGANHQLVIFCLTFGFGPFRDDFWPSIGNAMAFSAQRSVGCAGLTGSRRSWLTCRTVQQSTQSSKSVTNLSRFGWIGGQKLMDDRIISIIETLNLLKWPLSRWAGTLKYNFMMFNKNDPCPLKLDKLVRKCFASCGCGVNFMLPEINVNPSLMCCFLQSHSSRWTMLMSRCWSEAELGRIAFVASLKPSSLIFVSCAPYMVVQDAAMFQNRWK